MPGEPSKCGAKRHLTARAHLSPTRRTQLSSGHGRVRRTGPVPRAYLLSLRGSGQTGFSQKGHKFLTFCHIDILCFTRARVATFCNISYFLQRFAHIFPRKFIRGNCGTSAVTPFVLTPDWKTHPGQHKTPCGPGLYWERESSLLAIVPECLPTVLH